MTEGSLPRRARETRRRFDEIDANMESALRAYNDRMEEHRAKVLEVAKSGDTEALSELMRAEEEESRQRIEALHDQLAELRRVGEEAKMIGIEANVEGTKLRFDAVKQQATFSVAALAGVTAIVIGVLPEHLRHAWLLWITYGLLLATIVISLILLYFESIRVEYISESGRDFPERGRADKIHDILLLSALGLPIATITFLIFALLNL